MKNLRTRSWFKSALHVSIVSLAVITLAGALTGCRGGRKLAPGEVLVIVQDLRSGSGRPESVSGTFISKYFLKNEVLEAVNNRSATFKNSFRVKLINETTDFFGNKISVPLTELAVQVPRDATPIPLSVNYARAREVSQNAGTPTNDLHYLLKVTLTANGPVENFKYIDSAEVQKLEARKDYQDLPSDDGALEILN